MERPVSTIRCIYEDTTLYGEQTLKPIKYYNSIICSPAIEESRWDRLKQITLIALAVISYPVVCLIGLISLLIKTVHYLVRCFHSFFHPSIPVTPESFIEHNMKVLNQLNQLQEHFESSRGQVSFQRFLKKDAFSEKIYFAGYFLAEKKIKDSWKKIENTMFEYFKMGVDLKDGLKFYLYPYTDNYENPLQLPLILLTNVEVKINPQKTLSFNEINAEFLSRASAFDSCLFNRINH
jgi:hypothetical protein